MDFSVAQVSSKGQITIPAKIRKRFPSSTLIITYENDIVKMKPLSFQESEDKDIWQKISEPSFQFWDNPEDDIWNNV